MILQETIVALATPSGAGAIAIIRVSGKEAISLVNSIFKSIKKEGKITPPRLHIAYSKFSALRKLFYDLFVISIIAKNNLCFKIIFLSKFSIYIIL